jgi:hypothetical protein
VGSMGSVYCDDVWLRLMTHGEIAIEEGVREEDTNDPEVLTVVLSGLAGEDLGLLGGRDAVRALLGRLADLLADDGAWA